MNSSLSSLVLLEVSRLRLFTILACYVSCEYLFFSLFPLEYWIIFPVQVLTTNLDAYGPVVSKEKAKRETRWTHLSFYRINYISKVQCIADVDDVLLVFRICPRDVFTCFVGWYDTSWPVRVREGFRAAMFQADSTISHWLEVHPKLICISIRISGLLLTAINVANTWREIDRQFRFCV